MPTLDELFDAIEEEKAPEETKVLTPDELAKIEAFWGTPIADEDEDEDDTDEEEVL